MSAVLSKLKNILLYGPIAKLRPYEEVVLDTWRKHLSTSAKALMGSQLECLPCRQRQAKGKLLCFFPSDDERLLPLPQSVLFPCKLEECVVARFHLSGPDSVDSRREIKAEIILHEGRISSLEFNKPPEKFLKQGVNVTKVEILRDPMVPASEETMSDSQRRGEILASIQSKLPEEYLQWVGEGKELSFHEWTVYGLPKIRKIPQRDGNYYLLAERDGMGAVGVKEDEMTGQLYYLDYGDDRGEKLSVGLKEFLEKFDGGKVVGRF